MNCTHSGYLFTGEGGDSKIGDINLSDLLVYCNSFMPHIKQCLSRKQDL